MSELIKIAVDAMGGDGGPSVVVPSTEKFLLKHHDAEAKIFGDSKIIEKYYDGLNRFSRLLDTSNWIRVAANIRFIENLEIFTFLFGDIYGLSLEFSEFKGKFITPHNLFLSILYNSGILYTLIYYHTYLKYAANFIFLHILLIPYHLILGFGAYYGFILLILAIFNSELDG